jgi:hypothetical protein
MQIVLYAASYSLIGYLYSSLLFAIWIKHLVKELDLRYAAGSPGHFLLPFCGCLGCAVRCSGLDRWWAQGSHSDSLLTGIAYTGNSGWIGKKS